MVTARAESINILFLFSQWSTPTRACPHLFIHMFVLIQVLIYFANVPLCQVPRLQGTEGALIVPSSGLCPVKGSSQQPAAGAVRAHLFDRRPLLLPACRLLCCCGALVLRDGITSFLATW